MSQKGEKMKKTIIRIISMFMLLTTFYMIFSFSAQDGIESGSLSNKVTTVFVNHFPYTQNLSIETQAKLIEHGEPIVRKLAHFSIYTVVGMCIMAFLCTFPFKLRTRLGVSLLVGLVYAMSDEFHQSFVPRKRTFLERCWNRYCRSILRNTNYFSNCVYLYSIKKGQ